MHQILDLKLQIKEMIVHLMLLMELKKHHLELLMQRSFCNKINQIQLQENLVQCHQKKALAILIQRTMELPLYLKALILFNKPKQGRRIRLLSILMMIIPLKMTMIPMKMIINLKKVIILE